MKPAAEGEAPRGPKTPTQLPRTEIPSSAVCNFPVSEKQDSRSAVSQSSRQDEDNEPRSTRLSRQQAAKGTEEQGILCTEGIYDSVPPVKDA